MALDRPANLRICLVVIFLASTAGLLTEQKVYIQHPSITDYLYKYDLPAMDNFTYCMWLNMAHGLNHCFPVSVATSSSPNQHFYGWKNMQKGSLSSRVHGNSVWRVNSLSIELLLELQHGWHKHCFVNKKDEYIKWFMDRTAPGVLEEIETGDSLSTIPSGSALLLLQEQDSFKGGLDLTEVCISKMSMFNLWDTAMTVEELNALGCKDQGNVLNMGNLDYMGETPDYVSEEFQCPDFKGKTLPKRENSMMFCNKRGTTLSGHVYSTKPSPTQSQCAKLCTFDPQCQSANFRMNEQVCELNNINENDLGGSLESSNGTVHLSPVTC